VALRLLASGSASSNSAGGIDVSLLGVLRVVRYRSLRQVNHSSSGFLQGVVCLSVIANHRQSGGPDPLRAVGHGENVPKHFPLKSRLITTTFTQHVLDV
jgi:hypothetical protein